VVKVTQQRTNGLKQKPVEAARRKGSTTTNASPHNGAGRHFSVNSANSGTTGGQRFLRIVMETASVTGDAYFEEAPQAIARAWGGVAFIAEATSGAELSPRLIGCSRPSHLEHPQLELSPWIGDSLTTTVYYPSSVGQLFPDDPMLASAEVYLAVPLLSSGSGRIGYVGIIDDRAWSAEETAEAESMLRLAAPRAAAELERRRLEARMESHRPREDDDQDSPMEQLPAAVLLARGEEVVYANKRAAEACGLRHNGALDETIVITDEGRTTLRRWIAHLPRSRASHATIRLVRRRGPERAFLAHARPGSFHGDPCLSLILLDVTEQLRGDDELRVRAEIHESVLSSLALNFTVIGATGAVTARSGSRIAASNTAMLLPDAGVGDDYIGLCREFAERSESARRLLYGVGAVLGGSVPRFVDQTEVTDDEGVVRCYLTTATPLDAGGAVITHSDITLLKRGERELASREERERELLQNLPDQLARISGDGSIVDVQMPTARSNMVTLFPSAAFRRNVSEIMPADAAAAAMSLIHESTRSNAVGIGTLRIPFDEEEREYEIRAVPLSSDEALVLVRDKTSEQWVPRAYAAERDGKRVRVVRENPYGLTFREVGVLELMSHGASDKEIASKLGVSVFTVYKHVSKILHKMNAPSRTEASLRTVREGLFD
jgi:DNA-binding NarL/FixJ family response regulator